MPTKTVDIWKDFAERQGWSCEEFEQEVLFVAQAVLAFNLSMSDSNKVEIKSTQYEGNYKLTFEREG